MDEKEKILDNLFVAEDDLESQPKQNSDLSLSTMSKDIDSKSINNAVNELSKEFEKKNKEEFNRRKKEENIKNDVEEDLKENDAKKLRKSKVSFLLSILAFPFVLVGGVLIWNYFIAEKSIHPLAIITVLMCVTGFALGVKSFITGIMLKDSFKRKIKPLGIGLLSVVVAVLIIIFREQLEKYAFLVAGCISALIAFIALLSSAFKKDRSKSNIIKIVFSGLSAVGAVLLILAGTAFVNVSVYLQITGIYLTLVGCSLFIY